MGASFYVTGCREKGADYDRMKAIYENCQELGIPVPKEVNKYFNWDEPSEDGPEIDLEDAGYAEEYSEDGEHGFIVDLSSLPDDIRKVKFRVSY